MLDITQSIQSYINSMVEDIKSDAPNNTGALRSSIKSNILLNNSGYEVDIEMLNYGEFQDKGVNGTERSFGSPYSFRKQIPSSSFSGYTSNISGQFAIARSVMKKGIRPKNFIEPNIDPKLDGLANLTAEEIWNELVKKQNNN
jgi:hypothetical protein